MSITKPEAQALWNRLRSGLLGVERDIKEIVETRAWEPLGYISFVEAWNAELRGVEFTGAMQAAVVLSLYDSGATQTEVAAAVHNVGPSKAEHYQKAHAVGLTPADAYDHVSAMMTAKSEPHITLKDDEVWVEAHIRKMGEKKNSIHMEGFTDTQMEQWKTHADAVQIKFKEFCRNVFEEAMENATKGMSDND